MFLMEYVGHTGLRSLTDGHLGRHLDYFKTLNDARVASLGFIKYNAPTTRSNKEKKTLKSSSMSVWFSTGLNAREVDKMVQDFGLKKTIKIIISHKQGPNHIIMEEYILIMPVLVNGKH